MENRLKIRVTRMFRSSFGSCRTRNFSDVMEKAVFSPNYHSHSSHLIEPMSPRLRPFPSIFKPKSLESSESLKVRCFDSFCDDFNGRSRLSAASHSCEYDFGFSEKVKESPRKKKDAKKQRKLTKKKKKNTQMKINHNDFDDFGGNWWYSSDDDDDDDEHDETETLFSSKSTSSDSSGSRRRSRRGHHCRRRKQESGNHSRVSSKKGNPSEMGAALPLPAKVKDSFAVVKRSSDPYSDFRTSMVEMIVEKQMFAPKDLENLLQCFLSLNSHHHHKIIVEVFTEIYDALFL